MSFQLSDAAPVDDAPEFDSDTEIFSPEVRQHIHRFRRRAELTVGQIDEATTIACQVIDEVKKRFVDEMQRAKEALINEVNSQNEQWAVSGQAYKADTQKLTSVNDLLREIGLVD